MDGANDMYEKLRERLRETQTWPSVFMFKFIVPDNLQKLAEVKALFGNEAAISFKSSSKGNFVSVTVKEVMLSEDEVIARYEKAAKIKNLIAL